MTPDQIEKLTDGMVKQAKEIKKNAFVLSWHTRGSVSYTDVLNLSSDEIDSLNEMIDNNMETTKKSKLPFF
jgi:hypothetical protein